MPGKAARWAGIERLASSTTQSQSRGTAASAPAATRSPGSSRNGCSTG
jgi:hypothetical protein